MIYEKDSSRWAESTFGQCNLDDPRRLKRLVDIAARLSDDPSGSISHENFERVMMITAPVAVRILQLRSLSDNEEKGCDFIFEEDQRQCLFASTNPGKPLPDKPPSAQWAYYSLAKLAGWTDSKRTGRVGWQPLWTGRR